MRQGQRKSSLRALVAALLGVVFVGLGPLACVAREPPHQRAEAPLTPRAAARERLRGVRAREDGLRARFSPREQAAWIDVSGSDPYRLVSRSTGAGFVGLLRGSRAVVTLDEALSERERVVLRETPTALCVDATDQVWVASRYGKRLLRLARGARGELATAQELDLPLAGVADLACGEHGLVHVLPTDGSDLLSVDRAGRVLARKAALPGAFRLQRRARYLLEASIFERSVRVLELDAQGLPGRERARLRHDGTLWAFDAIEEGAGLLIAVAGVEDKPLVRAHGEFENIDSFVWLYRLGRELETVAALDLSDLGVVVPKALHLERVPGGLSLTVIGAGSGRLLRATWPTGGRAAPVLVTLPVLPGVSDAVFDGDGGVAYADPLFDAWVKLDAGGTHVTRVDPERRPEPDVRLGEALFFAELMAPENVSTGTHSRFTCETCHFEGGVDGRRHYTGRADVSVMTKPLFGLANNRPHFSRAMDPDLSAVCHNEFRVAGAGSGADPWFRLATSRFPWLHELGIDRAELGPLDMREALLQFFYAFSHAPNARSQGRDHFSPQEAAGARAFREHCQSCHAARLFSDDPASEVSFADWEDLIFSRSAPLVWARGDYAKTGVVPYVHEQGTRITSLRRLALKPRYFTNGSAADLATVLARFRQGAEGALHDAPADARSGELDTETRSALLAFLQLI